MVIKKFDGLKIIIYKNNGNFSVYKKSTKHITNVDLLTNLLYFNALNCANGYIKNKNSKIKDGFTYFSYDNINDKLVPSEQNYDFSASAQSENDLLKKLENNEIKIILESGYYLYLNVNGKILEYGRESNYMDFPEIYYKKYEEIIEKLDLSIVDFYVPISNDKYDNYIGICNLLYKHLQIENSDIFMEKLQIENNIFIMENSILNKELIPELKLSDNFLYYQMLLREFKNVRYNKNFKKENLVKMQNLKAAILIKLKAKLWEF